ncbi:MAG: intradiol ring-cleavage dioxygenase [Deltaproteobacteria bacterium]|nr:intradiol ring-cleavage dioxygenase [Deltaproteobacteria bacterium]
MTFRYSRRQALWLSAGLVTACSDRKEIAPSPEVPLADATPHEQAPPPGTDASPRACTKTHDNIEGPYYRAGAPERGDLTESGMTGTPLVIEGRVQGFDCQQGIAGVELDVWHATHEGHYDNDGTMRLGDKFLLRGRIKTDAEGRYRVKTIVPGRYLNGRQYRPAHVHVKVRPPQGSALAALTTQLYFPGDPYNDVDPFIHRSLIMDVEKASGGMRGHFDFVLERLSAARGA